VPIYELRYRDIREASVAATVARQEAPWVSVPRWPRCGVAVNGRPPASLAPANPTA
jgi:hypothetical protein